MTQASAPGQASSKTASGRGTPAVRYLSGARRRGGTVSSTTPHGDGATQVFEVIHPFHPLRGQCFELVEWRSNWGEERVYYQDADGRLKSLPTQWTSLGAADPFILIAAGRAHFHVAGLVKVCERIRELRG